VAAALVLVAAFVAPARFVAPVAAQSGAVTDPAGDALKDCDPASTPGPGIAPAMDVVEASGMVEKDGLSFHITTQGDIGAYFDSLPPSAAFVVEVELRKGTSVRLIDELHEGIRRTYIDAGALREWSRALLETTYERQTISVFVTEVQQPSIDWLWGLSAYNMPTPDTFYCDQVGRGPDGSPTLPLTTAPVATSTPTDTPTSTPSAATTGAPSAVASLLPTSAPQPTPGVSPGPSPAPSSGEGGPDLLFPTALVLLGASTLAGIAGIAGALGRGPAPPGGGVGPLLETIPRVDCRELRSRCEEARRAAEAASQAARDARAAAERARADCDAARRRLVEAEAALQAAEADRPDENSWIEGGGRRITTHDLRLKSAASQAAWDAYQRGEMTAQGLEAEWRRLGEEGALDELRRADAESRAARQAKARADADAARAAEQAAWAAADEADAALAAAEQAASEARAQAEAACRAADECEKQQREEEAAAAAGGAAGDGGRAGGGGRPGGPGGPGRTTTGTPPGAPETPETPDEPTPSEPPGTEDDHDEAHHCCPGGVWAGYGFTTGGIVAILGYESLVGELYCVADPSKRVAFKASFPRLGIGLGGEAAGTAIVVWGQDHADAAAKAMEGILGGLDGDLSVGIPFAKAAKAGRSGWQVHRLLKRFEQLRKAGGMVTREAVKELVEGAGKGTARSLSGQSATNVVSGAESVAPGGVVIPLGPGLQAGLWWKLGGSVEITSIDCCSCG
jgi:hypothetical protein